MLLLCHNSQDPSHSLPCYYCVRHKQKTLPFPYHAITVSVMNRRPFPFPTMLLLCSSWTEDPSLSLPCCYCVRHKKKTLPIPYHAITVSQHRPKLAKSCSVYQEDKLLKICHHSVTLLDVCGSMHYSIIHKKIQQLATVYQLVVRQTTHPITFRGIY
jgi:hypothetical protein